MRTSLYSILCIVIRLGAVLLAVQTMMALPMALKVFDGTTLAPGWIGTLIGFGGAMLALAALLWTYPGVLARIAAGRATQQVFESPLAAEELEQIALAVLGMWFAISGIIELINVGLRLAIAIHAADTGGANTLLSRELAQLATLIVKIALGVGLALGSRGLVGVLRRVREEGLPPAAAEKRSDEPLEPPP